MLQLIKNVFGKALFEAAHQGLRLFSVTCLALLFACGPGVEGTDGGDDGPGPPVKHTLSVKRAGTGNGTVTGLGLVCQGECSASFIEGSAITLTAWPAGGSVFAGWAGCDSMADTSCTVTMAADRMVTVSFNPAGPNQYTLTVAKAGSGAGTVTGMGISCGATCSGAYTAGTAVTLTATAASGSSFAGWSGCDSATGATCSVTLNAARTVTATFTLSPQRYTLTVQKAGTGTGTVSGSGISCGAICAATYDSGTRVTLTAAAASGSKFDSWSGCDSTAETTCTVTMNASRTVTATFTPLTYRLTLRTAGTGTGTLSVGGLTCTPYPCGWSYPAGTGITVQATPTSGSTFDGWSGCDATSGTTCTVTMNADRTVTGTFSHCTIGLTRCIAGDVSVFEKCEAGGWARLTCQDYQMCTRGACANVCGLASVPSLPTLCMVPNGDGVNNGLWFYWNDSRMALRTYTGGGVLRQDGTPASIVLDTSQTWPYKWSSLDSNDMGEIDFLITQFTYGINQATLTYRVRPHRLTYASPSCDLQGVFNAGTLVATSKSATVLDWTTLSFTATSTLFGAGVNSMTVMPSQCGVGDFIDMQDLNWMRLSIVPR